MVLQENKSLCQFSLKKSGFKRGISNLSEHISTTWDARIYSLVIGHKNSDVKLLADGDTGGFCLFVPIFLAENILHNVDKYLLGKKSSPTQNSSSLFKHYTFISTKNKI